MGMRLVCIGIVIERKTAIVYIVCLSEYGEQLLTPYKPHRHGKGGGIYNVQGFMVSYLLRNGVCSSEAGNNAHQ